MGFDQTSNSIKLEGWDALLRRLDALPKKPAENALVRGLSAGAAAMKKRIVLMAPERGRGRSYGGLKRISKRSLQVRAPGYLKRNIKYRKVRGRLVYHVGPSRAAFYARVIHDGLGRVKTPNQFLERAWQFESPRLLKVIADRVEKQIAKEVKKLNGLR